MLLLFYVIIIINIWFALKTNHQHCRRYADDGKVLTS